MTRDEIIRIYLQVSDELCEGREWCWMGVDAPLQRFAALVAAAERERAASICEAISWSGDGKWFASRIREGGHVSEP
jgi:hypothetical protein